MRQGFALMQRKRVMCSAACRSRDTCLVGKTLHITGVLVKLEQVRLGTFVPRVCICACV